MIAQVSSEELAKDVSGAEALLERNHVRFLLCANYSVKISEIIGR
jgi:hypothetical protein